MADEFDMIVCGSGPAGLAAALSAAQQGASVLLLEKQSKFGGKLPVSGNGRCNYSNLANEVAFMNAFGRAGRFMTDALRCGGHEWLCSFLEARGVRTASPDGFHCFPADGDAQDVLNAFLGAVREAGVACRCGTTVSEVFLNETGAVRGVRTAGNETILCRSVVLACGGNAMGGSESGLRLASRLGHTLVSSLPAMAPLFLGDDWIPALSGVSLPDAELKFIAGRLNGAARGELLFTHDGLSGPAALNLSGPMYRAYAESKGKFSLRMNFGAGTDWRAKIDLFRRTEGGKLLKSSLGTLLPRSVAAALCECAGFADRKNQTLRDADRDELVKLLSAMPLTVSELCPMNRAMAMSGGVTWKEICPETMESRKIPGLYFAGELLDLTGPCGGYNIQFAFASGRLAGLSAGHSTGKGSGTGAL